MKCPVCKNNTPDKIGEKNDLTLVKCPTCACIYVDPIPKMDSISEIYEGYLPTEKYLKKLKKKILTSRYKIFRLKKYQKNPAKKFLDVGCNIGATVRAAQLSGYKATGIDLDSKAVNHATELFEDCEFIACPTFELVKTERKFDFIYCSEVIEHIPDVHTFVQSLADLMETNAILYLTTPDAGHSRVPKNILDWKEVKPPEHLVFFNKSNIRILLQEHGIEVIKVFWNHRANLRVACRKK
ncbi:MAG: class I SAM-dependent methyltransferase [Proteobacteria bacterium]|nr:class I SAM-dependent methyltransferase [Pseudomonadota bacterium]